MIIIVFVCVCVHATEFMWRSEDNYIVSLSIFMWFQGSNSSLQAKMKNSDHCKSR